MKSDKGTVVVHSTLVVSMLAKEDKMDKDKNMAVVVMKNLEQIGVCPSNWCLTDQDQNSNYYCVDLYLFHYFHAHNSLLLE